MRNRIRFVGLMVLVSFVALGLRLFYWQIIRGPELGVRADSQYYDTLKLPAKRGDILDRQGMVLAGSVPTFLLYAYKPNLDVDVQEFSLRLAKILDVSDHQDQSEESVSQKEQSQSTAGEIEERLRRSSVWEPLAARISAEQKSQLEQWEIPGLGFQPSSSRFYPDASMSAHLLGFVGKDTNGEAKGYFGLEGNYDRELKGAGGSLKQEKDALGKPILVGSFQEIEPQAGRTLLTHIDRYVERIVEEELKLGLSRYGASAGEAMIMDPKTGAVIASASYPNYDQGSFWKFDPSLHKNPTVSDSYEPGSTFKVVVMAAALDSGVIDPETTCDSCAGPVQIGKYSIRTWNDVYRPGLSARDILVHSDNTGMVFVSHKLGEEKLVEYIKKFGFGELSGIDLQGEMTPELRRSWSEVDLATASFGQGVAVTTVQMLRAVGAIANGGVLVTPRVVSSMLEREEIPVKAKPVRRVVSEGTAKDLTEMMTAAVREGEAKFAAPKGYRVAGKTGTAQIPLAGHYDQEKTIASFVGFAPADDPQFVMIVKLREPTSSPWGSETAAPLWFSIAKKLFVYWNIPPSD